MRANHGDNLAPMMVVRIPPNGIPAVGEVESMST